MTQDTCGVDDMVTQGVKHEVEQYLLGTLLFKNEALNDVMGITSPEHFSDVFHQDIYANILAMRREGIAFNPLTILPRTHAYNQFSDDDKRKYLTEIYTAANTVFWSGSARDYAKTLRALFNEQTVSGVMSDPTRSALEKAGLVNAVLREMRTDEESIFAKLNTALPRTTDAIEFAYKSGGDIIGIRTGLPELDDTLSGLNKGCLYVVAGRPGMGKTAFALTVAANVARDRKPVLFFSLEMTDEQLCHRLIARATGIAAQDLMRGRLPGNDFVRITEAQGLMAGWPLTICDKPGLTVDRITALAHVFAKEQKPAMVVIDHLAIISARDPATPRVQQITEMTMALKCLAKELDCPILLLHQLSRAVETRDDKRPGKSDLRDSGSVEQDADAIMLLYRHEYYLRYDPRQYASDDSYMKWMDEHDRAKGKAEVIVAKNRFGIERTIHLSFDGIRQKFSEIEVNHGAH